MRDLLRRHPAVAILTPPFPSDTNSGRSVRHLEALAVLSEAGGGICTPNRRFLAPLAKTVRKSSRGSGIPVRAPSATRGVAPWVLLILLLAAGQALGARTAAAQEAGVQGILLEEATSQPLRGANVTAERDGRAVRATLSDRNGFFQLVGLPPGTYRLRIVLLGYATLEEAIQLEPGARRTVNRSLALRPLELEGIDVARQEPGAVRRELGAQTITSRELARVPTPAASADLVNFLQTQPGVVGSGDRGGQLFIRGGTPAENLALMDGMLIFQPFHITGFFSVFPEELVDRADFFAGGFGARYAGRISSVLDVQMRDGNRNRGAVTASVSPFLAEAVAEGPLGGGELGLSYIASARRSLVEETSEWLLGETQPLGFNSQYLRLSQLNQDGGSRCALTLMRSSDRGGLDPEDRQSRVGWTNGVIGGRCTTLAGATFMDVRFGWSGVSSEAVTRGASAFSSSARRLTVEGDFSRAVGPLRLNAGMYTHMEASRYDLRQLLAVDGRGEEDWVTVGAFAETEIPVGERLRVLPGVAWYSTTRRSPSIEPRLRAALRVPGLEDAEIGGAVGVYEQRLAGIADRRDASSIFTAWVRTPPQSRMRALHAQASWQQRIGYGFSYSLDGYVRRMRDLPVTTWTTVARFTPDVSLADGRSHGADTRIEFRRGPLYLFGAYAYSTTEYRSAQEDFGVWFGEPVVAFHPPHDRRHQVSALASLEVGRYAFGARWAFGSGFPFTRPLGFDEAIDLRTDRAGLPLVTRTFGETRVLVDRPYDGRLPASHHLDLSAKRRVALGARELELQAGVINAYDRANIFYYDVFTRRRIDQLPLAPYMSVKLQPHTANRR
jgi:hypothetical protein